MKKLQIETLIRYIQGLVAGEKGSELLKRFQIHDASFTALEVMMALDKVILKDVDMEKLKIASNKLFNILYETLSVTEKPKYPEGSILAHLVQDNQGIKEQLADTRKYIKQINREITPGALAILQEHFDRIQLFTEHYAVMQNIVFPEIERGIKEHRCLQLMWAFHDDISMNIQKTLEELQAEYFDLAQFNVASSKVYFAINTILFREENVLFPIMFELLDESSFPKMLHQLREFKLAFSDTSAIQPNSNMAGTLSAASGPYHIQLSTGILDIQQLELIFKNLPVDITFVDENDEVKYFSSPEHRVFPRTTGIIGRKVQNCHPHESVHVVNQIVEAFKKGEKSEASFWIKMGAKYVLIKYFALRDNAQAYRGVLEVSQEISEIQKIRGERRLLDW